MRYSLPHFQEEMKMTEEFKRGLERAAEIARKYGARYAAAVSSSNNQGDNLILIAKHSASGEINQAILSQLVPEEKRTLEHREL